MTRRQTAIVADAPVPTPIVAFWNATLAPKFIRFRHILEGGLSRHSEAVLPTLGVRPGDRIADVGCGFGDTAIALAASTGPSGHVTGLDCCDAFLDIARRERAAAGADNLDFIAADAETALPQGAFDFVFARFGTMFFTNPVAGLRNMRRALRPGGRMTHIVWRDRADNPWLAASREILLRHLASPDTDAPSCGPGPFSMADPAVVEAQMRAAGFIDITLRRVDAKVLVGRDRDEAVAFQLAIGPAGEIFRNAGPEAERRRAAIEADLRAMFDAEDRDDTGIWMDSSSWVVSGVAPEV